MSVRQHSRWCWAALFALGIALASNAPCQTNTAPRLVASSAGQFAAHAPDAVWSSVLCVLATQVKREWLRRLELPDKWRDPIVLVLAERPAAVAAAPGIWREVLRSELHLKFQIQLRIPPPLEEAQVVSALVGALCSEYANRAREFPRQPPFAVAETPAWLTEGLAQSVSGNSERLLPILRRGVNGGHPPSAQDLIGARSVPTDPDERLRFQAHTWALVEGLLSLPKGADKLCQLMCQPEMFAEIYRWQFQDDAAREKWWSLLLAERAATMLAEDRTAAETSRQLAEILSSKLQMRLPDAIAEAPVAFANLGRYTDKDWLMPLVRDKLARLASLRGVAHPSYCEAIDRYIAALQCLTARQVSRFQHETKRAQRAHAAADDQSRKVSAYVDQVERVHAPPDRAAVWRQLKLFEAIQETNILRRDPISDYLDKFDR